MLLLGVKGSNPTSVRSDIVESVDTEKIYVEVRNVCKQYNSTTLDFSASSFPAFINVYISEEL